MGTLEGLIVGFAEGEEMRIEVSEGDGRLVSKFVGKEVGEFVSKIVGVDGDIEVEFQEGMSKLEIMKVKLQIS